MNAKYMETFRINGCIRNREKIIGIKYGEEYIDEF